MVVVVVVGGRGGCPEFFLKSSIRPALCRIPSLHDTVGCLRRSLVQAPILPHIDVSHAGGSAQHSGIQVSQVIANRLLFGIGRVYIVP